VGGVLLLLAEGLLREGRECGDVGPPRELDHAYPPTAVLSVVHIADGPLREPSHECIAVTTAGRLRSHECDRACTASCRDGRHTTERSDDRMFAGQLTSTTAAMSIRSCN
jgi:hypothetical protein